MGRAVETASVDEAIQFCEEAKAAELFDLFRGQTRDWRPLRTSLGRLDEAERARAVERLGRFRAWVAAVPEMAPLARDKTACLAVAQHYGIATHYLDFTTEPRIAGFFATHEPPSDLRPDEHSCIICVNSGDLRDFWQSLATVRPQWPPPTLVCPEVPELWRLHAQHSVFLFLPYEDFERIYDFDRVYFPAGEHHGGPPPGDVYPKQESRIEQLIAFFFMQESIDKWNRSWIGGDMTSLNFAAPEHGFEAACFGPAGLPVLASWSDASLRAWRVPAAERWVPYSVAPRHALELPDLPDPAARIDKLEQRLSATLAARPGLREGPVVWECPWSEQAAEGLRLLWDGIRRFPYATDDLARGLAVVAVVATMVETVAGVDALAQERIVEHCLGRVIEVEIGMVDGSYTRGYAEYNELATAVRADFADYLNEGWRGRINSLHHVLQVAPTASRVFEFEALARVFVRSIAPTQVCLRHPATGKGRLYNVAEVTLVGLP